MTTEGKGYALRVDAEFRTTQYAEHLKANPRWSRYQPEGIDNESWRNTLHADSDGLDNARLMIRLTELFLEHDTDNSAGLSEEDKTLLYLAMAVQNWGKSFGDELSPGNDISYEFITSNEVNQRRRKLHSLIDELIPDLDVKRKFIVETAIYDRSTKLGEVFDAVRRLNCLRTGIIAYERYRRDPTSAENAHLGALSLGVLSNQLTHLIAYAEKYTPVRHALDESNDIIEEILDDRSIREHEFIAPQHVIEAVERMEVLWSRSHGDKSKVDFEKKNPKDGTIFSPNSVFERRFINDKEDLGEVIRSLKALGLRITLTSGSFDLIHIGHAKYLERASQFGDILVVGVDADNKIKARKGESRPVVGESERVELLAHIRGVDLLTLKDISEEKWGLIKLIRPHTLVVTAETYTPQEITELERLYCERVVVLEPQATTSTGAQIRKIQIGERVVLTEAIDRVIEEGNLSQAMRKELAKLALRLRDGS